MRLRAIIAATCATLLIGFAAEAAGKTIQGRWRLVEQTYGEGRANLAAPSDSLVLEFIPQGPGHAGRVHAAKDPSASWIWPVWEAEGRILPVQILERHEEETGAGVRVRYMVSPSEGDEMLLEVVEEYALSPDGGSLAGTVKATFRLGDETRGSFVLHRRFERIP